MPEERPLTAVAGAVAGAIAGAATGIAMFMLLRKREKHGAMPQNDGGNVQAKETASSALPSAFSSESLQVFSL